MNSQSCQTSAEVIDTENTMLVSLDIKFIRRDQKQHRNGEACRASLTCFWSSLINLISKDTDMVFYYSWIITRAYCNKTAKQMKSRHRAEITKQQQQQITLFSVLTLKVPNKNCSRKHFNLFNFHLSKKIRLMFHVNPLPSTGFTWNINSYFLWKTMKKYLWMTSAAVLIGTLRINWTQHKISLHKFERVPCKDLSDHIWSNLFSVFEMFFEQNYC